MDAEPTYTDATTTESPAVRRPRVLIIDDDMSICRLLSARLATEGVDVATADAGEAALELCARERIDAILLDVGLPGIDGYEVCRRLKGDPRTADVPVIFLSASASHEQRVKGLDLGAMDYIAKPFDVPELKARVRAALRVKRMWDLLAERAMVDGLTGLWNRAYFDQRLTAACANASRHGRWVSLLLLDVDHFKRVNDTHGHPAGDEVLRHVAAAVSGNVRLNDVVCRYGGEELAVIASETDPGGGVLLGERLRAGIAAARVRTAGRVLSVTASVGVAGGCGVALSDPATLIAAADRAMYESKQAGRDRVTAAGGLCAA